MNFPHSIVTILHIRNPMSSVRSLEPISPCSGNHSTPHLITDQEKMLRLNTPLQQCHRRHTGHALVQLPRFPADLIGQPALQLESLIRPHSLTNHIRTRSLAC